MPNKRTKKSPIEFLFQREHTILEITEYICDLLDKQVITRTELANRMGVTTSQITQWLDGRNITLKTVSDMLTALRQKIVIKSKPLSPQEIARIRKVYSPKRKCA